MTDFSFVIVAIMAIGAASLMLPESGEGKIFSIICSAAVSGISLFFILLDFPPKLILAIQTAFLWIYLGKRIYDQYAVSSGVNGKNSGTQRARIEARVFYSVLFSLTGFLIVLLLERLPWWLLSLPAFLLMSVLAIRALTGRNLFFNVSCENPQSPHQSAASRADAIKNVFERAQKYMTDMKPYAVGRLPQGQLAMMIGASTSDLSRAVSWYANKNYSQYVNDYRFEYAVDLMKRDPYMKVTEVGRMSGFTSEGAFTNAFKDRTGQTPSEFMRHERYRKKKESK